MIIGKRVRLRAIERSDLPRFVQWLNDPEVLQGLMLHVPMSLAQEENWFENTLKRDPVETPLAMEVDTPEGWVHIGNIGFHDINWQERAAEVGIFIGDKRYWSQGYGREAMRLMLKYGFETVNLHRIYLRVFESNPRAIRSYERAGFVHEGRERESHFYGGRYIDTLLMSVIWPEWDELKQREE